MPGERMLDRSSRPGEVFRDQERGPRSCPASGRVQTAKGVWSQLIRMITHRAIKCGRTSDVVREVELQDVDDAGGVDKSRQKPE